MLHAVARGQRSAVKTQPVPDPPLMQLKNPISEVLDSTIQGDGRCRLKHPFLIHRIRKPLCLQGTALGHS